MLKLNLVGERISGEPANEAAHFIGCPACGQPIDKRDLGAVLHHAEAGHAPLSMPDATRIVAATEQLRDVLKERP